MKRSRDADIASNEADEKKEGKEKRRKLIRIYYQECERPDVPDRVAVQNNSDAVDDDIDKQILVHFLVHKRAPLSIRRFLSHEFTGMSPVVQIDELWSCNPGTKERLSIEGTALQIALTNGREQEIIHYLLCTQEMHPNVVHNDYETFELVEEGYAEEDQCYIRMHLQWFGARPKEGLLEANTITSDLQELHTQWKRLPWTLHLITGLSTDIALLIDDFRCPWCPFG